MSEEAGIPGDAVAQTVLAEVLPDIAVVLGDVPASLTSGLVDLGVVNLADRARLGAALSAAAGTATAAGAVGESLASVQGLYRLSEATRATLAAGGRLAVKDGANLGTVITSHGLEQARFISITGLSAAQTAAAIGPAVATIALQMQLSEITSLVQRNHELTSRVLDELERGRRAELTGLAQTMDRAIVRAGELGSVPASLWEMVAGKDADLRAQRDHYRDKVSDHVRRIAAESGQARRSYVHENAETIQFDASALLVALKAWTAYQALQAGRARASAPDDPIEQRHAEAIARDTAVEVSAALGEARTLVDALVRELRIKAELPGRRKLVGSLPPAKAGSRIARETADALLKAIGPLAEALHPTPAPLARPGVLCAGDDEDPDAYLRVLRWFLDDDEHVVALGLPGRSGRPGSLAAAVDGARETVQAWRDGRPARELVVVTDRRLFVADSVAFLTEGVVRWDLPADEIRYVRCVTPPMADDPVVIEVTTRDVDFSWTFPPSAAKHVGGLVAVLAARMNLPESERDALMRRGCEPQGIEAGED